MRIHVKVMVLQYNGLPLTRARTPRGPKQTATNRSVFMSTSTRTNLLLCFSDTVITYIRSFYIGEIHCTTYYVCFREDREGKVHFCSTSKVWLIFFYLPGSDLYNCPVVHSYIGSDLVLKNDPGSRGGGNDPGGGQGQAVSAGKVSQLCVTSTS